MFYDSKNSVLKWISPHGRALPASDTPVIMGILNVSADSFSDGGLYLDDAAALAQTRKMLDAGARIIDIGAESTRPNSEFLTLERELELLLPKIEIVRRNFPDVAISADTNKPEIARAAISAGADIINDVVAKIENGVYEVAKVAAQTGAPLIITHNSRGELRDGDFFDTFMDAMTARLDAALAAGVPMGQIVLDAGVGFGKTVMENFELIARLGEMRAFGCAVLLGVSRKSSLAAVVGDEMDSRDDATAAVSAITAFSKSADIIRVHNVAKNAAAIKTAKAILQWTK